MFQVSTNAKKKSWTCALLASTILFCSGHASAQTSANAQINYAAPLSQILLNQTPNQNNEANLRTLDWRKPSLRFTFDLPAANLTDGIELLISADPRSGVNPRAPLTVQFNNDEPVVLKANGQGFDARITLDPNKARRSRNIIQIHYGPEDGQSCILPQDGGWDINLDSSKLAINSRARRRALQFREIDTHLSSPGLAPRRVNIVATGQNATQLQALAAQGIGLRMDSLPNFTTDRRNSDFEVIMAPRAQLYQYVTDDSLLGGTGAAIMIARGRPVKLIFTGDTDAQILASVKSFAQRHLPVARRSVTSLGEMRLQSPLKSDVVRLSGTRPLIDIPTAASFTNWTGDDWASGPKSLRFDVTDPNAMSGEILLRLASSKNISETSKFSVRLNDKSLGTTLLDKRRKSVAFEIEPGLLRGKDNILTLMPELSPNDVPSCGVRTGPNFHIGSGSKIILNTDTPTKVTDLSRMSATAVPFSDDMGQNSYIAMTGSQADFHASLKVLARLAKTSGEGLIRANYTRGGDFDQAGNKHVLWLGPSNHLPSTVLGNAPRGLTDALKGRGFEGQNLISANIEQYASLDTDSSFKVAAQRISKSHRIREGGIAALYPSQTSDQHITGIITNTPGQSYVSSVNTLVQAPYWNEIEGGVARWNNQSVLMVQAAQNVANYVPPSDTATAAKPRFQFDTPNFDSIFNKTTEVSGEIWNQIKSFTGNIVQIIKPPSQERNPSQDITQNAPAKPDQGLAEAPQSDQIITAQNKLHSALKAANGWAENASANIRNAVSNVDYNLGRQLLNPKLLLLILALLVVLLSLSSTGPTTQGRRKTR